MKKITYLLLLAVMALTSFTACSDDDTIPEVTPTATGTMTDNDGNEYHWVRIGNLDWMAENYYGGPTWYNQKYVTENGLSQTLYADDDDIEAELCKQRGSFYTYQQAMDQAPDGWRLPTDEEWKQLEMALGMSRSAADSEGWRDGAGLFLTKADGFFRLPLAGTIGAYSTAFADRYHDGDYGCYWTATKDTTKDAECVFIRKVMSNTNKVQRVACKTIARWMQVRYVRDAK